MNILIVTGARSHDDSSAMRARCVELIALERAAFDAEVIVVGDTRGPDAWSAETADARCPAYVYRAQTGEILRVTSRTQREPAGRWIDAAALAAIHPKRRPLERNAACMRHVRTRVEEGTARALCVALFDARKRPWNVGGTAHTVSLARAARIEVHAHVVTP